MRKPSSEPAGSDPQVSTHGHVGATKKSVTTSNGRLAVATPKRTTATKLAPKGPAAPQPLSPDGPFGAAAPPPPRGPTHINNGADGTSAPPAPPAQPDLGPNLLVACDIVSVAGCWLEKLAVDYENILGGVGRTSSLSFSTRFLEVMADGFSDGDGWTFNGWHWTSPCRYQRERIGSLSFVVDLGKPGRPARALGYPCAIVAWSGIAHDWLGAIGHAGGFWPPSQTTTHLIANRLIAWSGTIPGNGPSDPAALRSGSWFYVVPLTSLHSTAKLQSHVVQPALALLNNGPIEAAFATAPDVLQFDRRKSGELVIVR